MKTMIRNLQVATLILTTLLLFACGGAEERKAAYIAKAKTYISEENFEKAQIELKNALQIDPKDIEARYLIAEVAEKLKEWSAAAGYYKSIVEIDKSQVEARVQLGRLFFLSGNYKESRKLTEEILQLDPKNPGGLTLMASIYSQAGETKKAIETVNTALQSKPSDLEASALLASLYSKEGRMEEAEILFKVTVGQYPDNIQLRVLLGNLYVKEGNEQSAIEVFTEITRLSPKQLVHRVRLASLLVRFNKINEAEEVLRAAILHDPDDVEAKLVLADFFIQKGIKGQAEKELLGFIEQSPETYRLRSGLAKFYVAEGQPEKAKQVYRTIIEMAGLKNAGLEARVRLARLFMTENKLNDAATLLDETLVENSQHDEALIARGELALARKDPINAITDFRSALRNQPNSLVVLQNLARAHVLNNEYEQAIDNLKRAIGIDRKNAMARLQLARLLAANGNIDESISTYQDLLKVSPENIDARAGLFSLFMKKADYESAAGLASETKNINKGHYLGYFISGTVLQAQKKYDDSIVEFELALNKKPDENRVLAALVRSYLLENKTKQAIKRVERAVKASPDNVAVMNMLSEVLLFDKQPKRALGVLIAAQAIKPDWINTYNNMVRAQLALSNKPGAFRALEDGLANTNSALSLVVEMALLHEKYSEYDKAAAVYETALQQHPESAVLANNLAMLLVNHKQDQKNLSRAKELTSIFLDEKSPAYKDSVGWILYKNGEVNKAIPYLEQAVSKLSNVPVVNYHIGMAYFDMGDMTLSRQYLEKAVASKTSYTGLEEATATLDKLKQGE